jgi:hypothetical protein
MTGVLRKLFDMHARAHGRHPLMLRWPSWQLAASHCGSVVAPWLVPASSWGGFRQHRTSAKAIDAENSRRLARIQDERLTHSNLKWTATRTDRLVTGTDTKKGAVYPLTRAAMRFGSVSE